MTTALSVLAILMMFAALLAIPLGLPGIWIMIAVLAVGAYVGEIGVLTLALLVLVAIVAEVLEFLTVKRYNLRYGGSRLAFWGAIVGGLVGVVVGLPIPIVGPLVAAFLGTLVGAAAVTLWETRHIGTAARVGWGVLIARALAAGLKVAAGFVILVTGAFALLVG